MNDKITEGVDQRGGVPAGWQTMASAPRDRKIDLLFPEPRGRTIDCYWDDALKIWAWRVPTWSGADINPECEWLTSCYPNMQPTHWREPPVAPNAAAPKAPTTPDLAVKELVEAVTRAKAWWDGGYSITARSNEAERILRALAALGGDNQAEGVG